MKRINYIILIAITISGSVMISCKIGQKYKAPELNTMPLAFDSTGFEQGAAADIGWSTLYNDPILTKLIERALEHNKDMLIATARIKEMIANKRITFTQLLPEVGAEIAGQREYLNYGGHNSTYDPEIRANLNMAWELDIWGNLRWQNDAGIAAYMQSVEAQKALHLTIVAQVAQAYFELKALDRELRIVKQTLEARREGVRFAKLRYEGGLTSEIPYRQSLVELARTETLVPNIENEIKLKENDLAILVGEFPSYTIPRGTDINKMEMPESLPVDIPSALLRHRPDVRMAEQRLIEQNAQVAVALTDMFPKLRLTSRIGGESEELSNFLKSPTWFVSGLLTGPVFNFGRNKARHEAAKAVYEQEVYSYEKTVLNVFKEVNNAISSFHKAKEMHHSQEQLYASAQSYHQLARLQYVNGIINYIDVLDAQRQLFDAEIALNNAILNELIAVVNLYKALGGGITR